MYEARGKRVVDVGIVVMSSPITLFVSGLTALLISLEDGGPVLYRQLRVGAHGKPFWLLKFRSMGLGSPSVPSDEAGHLRVTRVGRVIRRLNLDELPQFINVLRGEMSIVGPRPALQEQQMLNTLRARSGASRLRPGMTGLAQLHSYDGMPVEEKAYWDGMYAGAVSFRTDVLVLARTWRYFLKPPPRY